MPCQRLYYDLLEPPIYVQVYAHNSINFYSSMNSSIHHSILSYGLSARCLEAALFKVLYFSKEQMVYIGLISNHPWRVAVPPSIRRRLVVFCLLPPLPHHTMDSSRAPGGRGRQKCLVSNEQRRAPNPRRRYLTHPGRSRAPAEPIASRTPDKAPTAWALCHHDREREGSAPARHQTTRR